MSKKSFLLGAIASVIAINSVFADTIVTSKQYVDTTRQATIPVAGTNENTPGSTVVTYTGTAGQIGERGICDSDAEENGDCDGDNLVTRDLLGQATDLPETTVTYKTCTEWLDGAAHTDQNCILWNLRDADVYGRQCNNTSDCNDRFGDYYRCVNGICDTENGPLD